MANSYPCGCWQAEGRIVKPYYTVPAIAVAGDKLIRRANQKKNGKREREWWERREKEKRKIERERGRRERGFPVGKSHLLGDWAKNVDRTVEPSGSCWETAASYWDPHRHKHILRGQNLNAQLIIKKLVPHKTFITDDRCEIGRGLWKPTASQIQLTH